MGIFLFFTPFSHTTAIKEICFYLSVFIILILITVKKINFSFKSPFSLPFALFTVWAFTGLFFALYNKNSIHDFYAHLLKYLAIYYMMINFFNSGKRLIVLSWIIIVSATIFSIGGLGYFYPVLGNSILTQRMTFQETPIGIIGFVSVFALLLSVHLLPRTGLLYKKILLLISFTVTSIVTVRTLSFGTLLSMILSILVLFPKNKKIVLFTLLLFATILVLAILNLSIAKTRMSANFIQNKLQNEERIKIWHTYFEIIKDYPISGIGFDMDDMWHDQNLWDKYSARIPSKLRTPTKWVPHNILLSITVRLGLVGLVLYLYTIFVFVRMSWIVIKHGKDDFIKSWGLCVTAAFIAWFIKGMLEPALSHVPAIINYTIFAMMTILWKLNSGTDYQVLQDE
ncbi:MAG TPA: O-antigen ligase family protein [Bacteroidales bacterium]|nr:O-antigen ligase family protein [Bacteroidales bacterium]